MRTGKGETINDLIRRQDVLNAPLKLTYDGMECIPVYHIEELPSVQSEPCEDAVSRKAVTGIYTSLWGIIGTIMDRGEWDDVCRTTANELPSVQPERKTGKWLIAEKDRYLVHSVQCSVCGNCISWMANYCPNCGSYNGGEG